MEPKKNLKKHRLTEPLIFHPEWKASWSQEELISKINEISNQIHRSSRRGGASWVLMGEHVARQFDEAMREHTIEMGDVRIEEDSHVQDIIIRPTRGVERIELDFNVLPSGGQFYTGTTQEGQEPWRHL
jgi:hypothetical protein